MLIDHHEEPFLDDGGRDQLAEVFALLKFQLFSLSAGKSGALLRQVEARRAGLAMLEECCDDAAPVILRRPTASAPSDRPKHSGLNKSGKGSASDPEQRGGLGRRKAQLVVTRQWWTLKPCRNLAPCSPV